MADGKSLKIEIDAEIFKVLETIHNRILKLESEVKKLKRST